MTDTEAAFRLAAALHKWINEQIRDAKPKGNPDYLRGYFDALLDTKNKLEVTYPTLAPKSTSTKPISS
jgi:hypothetical protein